MRYGEHANRLLVLIKEFDNYERERKDTTSGFRAAWTRDSQLVCAVCGLDKADKIEVAHRRALEEYGRTTEENLLPLCKSTSNDEPKNGQKLLSLLLDQYVGQNITIKRAADECGVRLGCHDLLDNGVIAKSELEHNAHKKALETGLNALEGEFGIRGKSGRIKKARHDFGLARLHPVSLGRVLRDAKDKPECLEKICRLISLLRRCGDADVRRALRLCRAVETELSLTSTIGKPLSMFHYEYALALQVGEPQNMLMDTLNHLKKSCEAAREGSGSWGMSQLEFVHAEILVSTATEVSERAHEWICRQDNALAAVEADDGLSPHNKARWRMNYLIHRGKLRAKIALHDNGTKNLLEDAVKQAWEFRATLTIMAGWTRFQGVHLVTLEGILLHMQGRHEEALQCLARGLRPMTTGRGKRPEGIKDIAHCIALCLHALGQPMVAKLVNNVGNEVFDQRSSVVL